MGMGMRMSVSADEIKLGRKSRHSFDWDAGEKGAIKANANRRDRRGVRRTIRTAATSAGADWDADELIA